MEIEQLKERWASHNGKIQEVLRINPELKLGRQLKGPRAWVWWFHFGNILEVVLSLPFLLGTAHFIYTHLAEPRFMVTGVALHLWFIATTVSVATRFAKAAAIDFSAPVLEIQRRIESLRLFSIRSLQVMFVSGVAVWTVLVPIVVVRAVIGIDLFYEIGTRTLVLFFIGCLALGLAIVKACTLWAHWVIRPGSPKWLRGSARAFFPYSLNRAADRLQKIAAFERD